MSAIGNALNALFQKIEDIAIFFFAYTLVVFIAGAFFGTIYAKTDVFWYPVYILGLLMVIKILIDLGRKKPKTEEKKE